MTPSPHARPGDHGEPLLWLRRRNTATNGSATGAARQQPPFKPPSGRLEGGVLAVVLPCPSPFFGQAAALTLAARRALSRPRSAERSEGSLDSRSPPSRYTLVPPGRAGVLAPGRPLGGSGSAGPARSERKPSLAGARGRGRRTGGRGA